VRGGWALLPGNQRQDERQWPHVVSGEVQIGDWEKCLYWKSGQAWPRLPRAVVESPSLGGFRNRVAVALGDRVQQAWGC